ncbi:MAG: hypothetical protein ABSF48_28615, partial [Thermodesulfobacteriota bacterium]
TSEARGINSRAQRGHHRIVWAGGGRRPGCGSPLGLLKGLGQDVMPGFVSSVELEDDAKSI